MKQREGYLGRLAIPKDGHASQSSESEPELGSRDVRLEAAIARRVNRTALLYYRPPAVRRPQAATTFNEALVSDFAMTPGAPALPDAAVASFGETAVLETVIGNDDRVKVTDDRMHANPWRQICALRIHSKTGRLFVGTGWFIAPRVLATVGHCVFLQNEGCWPSSIDVFPAKAGASQPFQATSKNFKAVDGWVKDQSRDFDYGVILLDDATLGRRLGNFAVRAVGDAGLRGVDAKISGYPADRDRAEFQYFHERPLLSTSATRLNYEIDTFGGQSGSPIWIDMDQDRVVAVGVHTTGGVSINSGTGISEDVVSNFIGWIQEE
jgi:glutamyl endopeptidase